MEQKTRYCEGKLSKFLCGPGVEEQNSRAYGELRSGQLRVADQVKQAERQLKQSEEWASKLRTAGSVDELNKILANLQSTTIALDNGFDKAKDALRLTRSATDRFLAQLQGEKPKAPSRPHHVDIRKLMALATAPAPAPPGGPPLAGGEAGSMTRTKPIEYHRGDWVAVPGPAGTWSWGKVRGKTLDDKIRVRLGEHSRYFVLGDVIPTSDPRFGAHTQRLRLGGRANLVEIYNV